VNSMMKSCARWSAAAIAGVTAAYSTYVIVAWLRYGRVQLPKNAGESDSLLDRFMPTYEVSERHHAHVAAPADVTMTAAYTMELTRPALIRAIFKGRELLMGARPDDEVRPRTLIPLVKSLGWGVLAEVPGREIVMGSVTKPWEANVVFRAITPEDFRAFNEAGYVKIAWTLRADRVGDFESVFRTETRVATTDASARVRFRRYWSLLSPGIIMIRRLSLRPLKAEAERLATVDIHRGNPSAAAMEEEVWAHSGPANL
jgi:hypothetical protein